MANIHDKLNKIITSIFGKDVRQAIYDGLDTVNKETENTTAKQQHLENTFDQLVINAGTSNAEIVDARVDKNTGKSYSKVGDRMDEVSSLMEQNTLHTKGSVNIYQYHYLVNNNDWTLAINTAIQENEGKKILLPEGDYLITGTIIVNKNVILEGFSKINTIIRVDTDIDMLYLQKKCEIKNITLKINLLNHTKTVLTYFAIVGGNKFGSVKNIDIIGLDGYDNRTKAFRFQNLDGTTDTKAYFFFYSFSDINVEFCDTFLYIDADFNKCWTTSVTWSNIIVERCKRGVLFDTSYVGGAFSRYDYDNCQYQYNTHTNRVFESSTDRSLVDWHIWDRSFFTSSNPKKSILIKKGGRHNRFIIRNVDESEVEYESPRDTFMNEFTFYDTPMSKNILRAQTIYVNYNIGDDSSADGSIINPYKNINTVIALLPKLINNNITIQIAEGTFADNVIINSFYGGGTLKIIGNNKINTWVNSIKIENNRCKVELQGFSARHASNGSPNDIGVTVIDSDIVNINDVDTISRATQGNAGYYVQGSTVNIRNSVVQKNVTAILATSSAHVWLDNVTGDNNNNGITCQRGAFVGLTVGLAVGFATNLYSATQGGLINTKGTILT